ncbi:alkaline protease [Prevotella sp. oral taxon 313]|uniref:TolC family protein n=1 Tax=Prevotella TaxID=838 RepID=UPI000D1F4A9C|nr:TolC family protein [Prevotella sp. oral taxon 313]PTL28075.1 alkaline protease [Prevotella sp. oral taxon 313]
MMKLFTIAVLLGSSLCVQAQEVYSLQKCRELALQNNRQLKISNMTVDVAENTRKAAKTKYLPRVDALAGYQHFSREISLLSDDQKNTLSNLGTNTFGQLGGQIGQNLSSLAQQGVLSPQVAQQLGQLLSNVSTPLTQAGNNIGQSINDAFRSNTKNVYAGGIVVNQPIYMGGAIKAANDMAAIGEQVAQNNISLKRQLVLYGVDNAYWLAISLKKKEALAIRYRNLAQKLNEDVKKMIREGVATRADGLKVEVAVNTADMQIARIQSGVSLAKMALCELCGLDLNGDIQLSDEREADLPPTPSTQFDNYIIPASDSTRLNETRPELRLLQNAVDMSKQNTKLLRSLYLPHILLTAGYSVSNPNLFNGFQKRFTDLWNIGVTVQVPVWTWGENKYKIRASRTATSIAQLEMDDVRKKIDLEIEQNRLRLKDANKQLATSHKNMAAAEENLRCANVGFKEGVMTVTEVMAAQTAWQTSRMAIIDAEISVKLAQAGLQKALGGL